VDCVLSSPLEVAAIRARWPEVEILCPGIREPDSPPDDQSRKMTPYEAVKAGTTGLVVGRLIRNPPEGVTREQMARKVREGIDRALAEMAA
jgi:orotidine-5'-phosphate decarboxylase